jgi:hypothetical protein
MSLQSEFSLIVTEHLPLLDELLSLRGIPFWRRPIVAAVDLAREFVLEFYDNGRTWKPNFDSPDFLSKEWFRVLYKETEDWYRRRYPAEFGKSTPPTVTGLVLIWNNPYALNVPLMVRRPEIPGNWISFPDYVLDTETPFDWIANPPDLSQLKKNAEVKLYESCIIIASLLRTIEVHLMGIERKDTVMYGLLDTLRGNISQAAEDILAHRRESATSGALWEIQMACECAFKALLHHKTGSFQKTHDLFYLYDNPALAGLSLNRDLLKNIPPWEEMASHRYGLEDAFTVSWYHTIYRNMLKIVAAVLEPMVRFRMGKGALKLGPLPWLKDAALPLPS